MRMQTRSPGCGLKTVVSNRLRLKGGNWRVRSTEVCWMVAFMVIFSWRRRGRVVLYVDRQDCCYIPRGFEQMIWQTKSRTFDLSQRALIMGVLNVTTDSFSDGG